MNYEERLGGRELKFLVTAERAAEIREWARCELSPDPHANGPTGDRYRVTSLYFDTVNFDVFHRRGSYARAKYRVRRYDSAPSVFVERKLRTETLVSKRRSVIAMDDVSRISGAEATGGWPGYWFQRRLRVRALAPVCAITYLRTARVATHAGGLVRMTIDEDLRAIPVDGPAFGDPRLGAEIGAGRQILELKYGGEMPAVFKRLLEKFALNRTSFSKYRTAAAAIGIAEPANAHA